MTNDQRICFSRNLLVIGIWSLVILWSLVIGHSTDRCGRGDGDGVRPRPPHARALREGRRRRDSFPARRASGSAAGPRWRRRTPGRPPWKRASRPPRTARAGQMRARPPRPGGGRAPSAAPTARPGSPGHLVGQGLDITGTGSGVGDAADMGLFHQDELGVAALAAGEFGGQKHIDMQWHVVAVLFH